MAGVDAASVPTDPQHLTPTSARDGAAPAPTPKPVVAMTVEYDDFGLPIRKFAAAKEPDKTETTPPPSSSDEPRQADRTRPEDEKESSKTQAQDEHKAAAPDGTQTPGTSRIATDASAAKPSLPAGHNGEHADAGPEDAKSASVPAAAEKPAAIPQDQAVSEARKTDGASTDHKNEAGNRQSLVGVSEFSHQQLTAQEPEKEEGGDGGWQTMPAYAPYDIYDDDNKLIAKEYNEADDETYGYAGLGGAGKGYTKVLLDDDAESATSMDENTQYLFKDPGGGTSIADEDQRDAVSQLQATKELLTEGQRVAYVGLTRLELSALLQNAELAASGSKAKKQLTMAAESMKMWSQKMMIRLYTHMDISPAEQVMIEQLSAHGVMPQDLTPVLMANARVRNPMAEAAEEDGSKSTSRPSSIASPRPEQAAEPPPPYSVTDDSELTEPVMTPSQLPTTQKIDIDIRWTVLCDLFLVLIADSVYDARSRLLLERVAAHLDISWLDICRFEKKVTDALEMQANAERENWNEDGHMENRRKLALKRRYMMMGLATVGGGLVIGLSAGLLAPVIGMGLAAGFATIGIGGTSGFLAGAGGAAIITSSAAASGGLIGIRAANRRTGAVKTFEYRPLHNNKRVNLIVTVSGWMTGKVDDVRLPFSTVDPVMGDIYSVLWEPEMLTSMGDTINILATEALTQGLQQLLGSTILISLMAAVQLPVVLTKLAYLIDNPWAVSLDRATMAGLILADSLIDRNLGTRPVTLVGYSLGSRVIFSCLQELAKKGAYGLVQNVYLFGSPMVVKKDEYVRARAVVSGRFVNGYNRNDWILGYLFRLTNGGIRRVAGLAAIEDVPRIENMDVSEWVVGHMDYRMAMPRLLRECGWLVESDEFTEIEDPDPDKYQERQRELINEIEEARRELEQEGKGTKGGAFGFFRRKKAPQKQEWEVYEESKGAAGKSGGGGGGKTEDKEGNNHGVLFDVDAIRAEIAKESGTKDDAAAADLDEQLLQVREIKSTLPPIKLDLGGSSSKPGPDTSSSGGITSPGLTPPAKATPRQSLRESRSAELVPAAAGEHRRSPSYGSSSNRASPDPSRSRSRTPTFPSSAAAASSTATAAGARNSSPYYHAYGYGGSAADLHNHHDAAAGEGDDGIQMTFEPGFNNDYNDHHHHRAKPSPSAVSSFSASSGGVGGAGRPGMIRSAQTVPNITLADPWADEDEEFGKEKEISMTFA